MQHKFPLNLIKICLVGVVFAKKLLSSYAEVRQMKTTAAKEVGQREKIKKEGKIASKKESKKPNWENRNNSNHF